MRDKRPYSMTIVPFFPVFIAKELYDMKWRITVLSLFVLLVSFLSLGAVKEFGNDIPYPAQAAFSLTDSSDVDKEQIFDRIEEQAKKHGLTIYRPFLDTTGKTATFVFGEFKDKNPDYVTDRGALATSSISGMYYSSRGVPAELETSLRQFGIKYTGADLPWYLVPLNFLFMNLRSLAVWTLFFVFAVLLFAVKMLYIKKAMIQRSLGIFEENAKRSLYLDAAILLGMGSFVWLSFILWQGSMANVYAKTFSLLLLINLSILILLSLLVNVLFALNIRLMSAVAVLKNKKSNPLVLYIWLFGILISCLIFGITVSESAKTISKSTQEIAVLGNWKVAQDYNTITWFENTAGHTDENHQLDADFMKENSAKQRTFIQSFGATNWLYSEQSSLSPEKIEYAPAEFKQELANNGVDTGIAEKLLYVNTGMIDKNKELYPQNQYGQTNMDGLGTIYIPKSQMANSEVIRQTINYEYFQYAGFKAEDFQIVEIPDGQKTFFFNHKGSQDELFAKQEAVDRILVQINFHKLPEDLAFDGKYDVFAVNGIFKQGLIKEKIDQAGLTNFSSMTNASEQLLLARETIISQLTGTIIALVMLVLAQFFIIYEYVSTRIKQKAKKVSLQSLLGTSSGMEIFQSLLPLILGIFFVSLLTLLMKGNILVIMLVGFLYAIEIAVMSGFALLQVKKHRVQIIKGDFEIV